MGDCWSSARSVSLSVRRYRPGQTRPDEGVSVRPLSGLTLTGRSRVRTVKRSAASHEANPRERSEAPDHMYNHRLEAEGKYPVGRISSTRRLAPGTGGPEGGETFD